MLQKVLKKLVIVIGVMFYLFMFVVLLTAKLDRNVALFEYFKDRKLIEDYIHNLWLILSGIIVIGIGIFVALRKKKIHSKIHISFRAEIILSSVIVLILQVILAYNICFSYANDASVMRQAAEIFVNGGWDEEINQIYFQTLPNNIYLYVVNIFFCWLGKMLHLDGFALLMIVGIIMVNMAMILVAAVLYLLTESRTASRIGFWLAVLLFGVSPWIVTSYSDTLSICVPVFVLYIYIKFIKTGKYPFLSYLGIFLIPSIMYTFKPLNFIILMAIVCCGMIYANKAFFSRQNLLAQGGAILITVFIALSLSAGAKKFINYEADDSKRVPIGYYFLLGANYETYGGWSIDDATYIIETDGEKEKNRAARERIHERWSNRGMKDYIKHYKNKTLTFYGDGTFSWGVAGFFESIPEERNDTLCPLLRNIFYPDPTWSRAMVEWEYGKYFKYYAIFMQFIWINVLLCGGLLCFFRKKDDRCEVLLLINYIGVFLFTMLFETSPRLLYSQLPMFVVMAVLGLANLYHWIAKVNK